MQGQEQIIYDDGEFAILVSSNGWDVFDVKDPRQPFAYINKRMLVVEYHTSQPIGEYDERTNNLTFWGSNHQEVSTSMYGNMGRSIVNNGGGGSVIASSGGGGHPLSRGNNNTIASSTVSKPSFKRETRATPEPQKEQVQQIKLKPYHGHEFKPIETSFMTISKVDVGGGFYQYESVIKELTEEEMDDMGVDNNFHEKVYEEHRSEGSKVVIDDISKIAEPGVQFEYTTNMLDIMFLNSDADFIKWQVITEKRAILNFNNADGQVTDTIVRVLPALRHLTEDLSIEGFFNKITNILSGIKNDHAKTVFSDYIMEIIRNYLNGMGDGKLNLPKSNTYCVELLGGKIIPLLINTKKAEVNDRNEKILTYIKNKISRDMKLLGSREEDIIADFKTSYRSVAVTPRDVNLLAIDDITDILYTNNNKYTTEELSKVTYGTVFKVDASTPYLSRVIDKLYETMGNKPFTLNNAGECYFVTKNLFNSVTTLQKQTGVLR